MEIVLCAITSYILGSIPTSYIFTRIIKGVDIREHGSGNAGATNTFRVTGKIPGIIVLILDTVKGYIAVMLIPRIFPLYNSENMLMFQMAAGAAVIIGHIYSVFLRFRGGKGVATSLGVMLFLAPMQVGVTAALWLLLFVFSRTVSLASIISASAFPFIVLLMKGSLTEFIYVLMLAGLIVYKHKDNMRRLLNRSEHKFTK